MPTIRFTPQQPTSFERFRETVLGQPRDALVTRIFTMQADALKQHGPDVAAAVAALAGQFETAGGSFGAELVARLSATAPDGRSVALAQVLQNEAVALGRSLGDQGALALALDGHVEPLRRIAQALQAWGAHAPGGLPAGSASELAARLIAALRPVGDALTDQNKASVATTNRQLEAWRKSSAAQEGWKSLQTDAPALAAAFWDQGRDLNPPDASLFEAARRFRLAELVEHQLELIRRVRNAPGPV